MLSNRLIRWAVVIVCVFSFYGCSKKTTTPTSPATTAQETPKTEAQYKAEADKQITEQNASQELNKLEQEVGADANQP
jgi:hypothetical protein